MMAFNTIQIIVRVAKFMTLFSEYASIHLPVASSVQGYETWMSSVLAWSRVHLYMG